jgi:hypothetical protein
MAAPRCSLLLIQLRAASSCLCLLAASCPVADCAPLPSPCHGVLAGTAVASAPAAGVPRTAVDDDGNSVPTTVPARGARRLGLRPPHHHLRLSDTIVPADAPAATASSSDAPASPSLLAIFSPVLFILGCGLFVAGLFKSADLCAAARAKRQKARRVRPLGQDQDVV